MTRDQQATAIAEAFSEVLRQWLSKDEFAEMKHLNETNPDYADKCCASHNYCDANMAMNAAFRQVVEREITAEDEDQSMSDAHCALWNKSWELARKLSLGSQR